MAKSSANFNKGLHDINVVMYNRVSAADNSSMVTDYSNKVSVNTNLCFADHIMVSMEGGEVTNDKTKFNRNRANVSADFTLFNAEISIVSLDSTLFMHVNGNVCTVFTLFTHVNGNV